MTRPMRQTALTQRKTAQIRPVLRPAILLRLPSRPRLPLHPPVQVPTPARTRLETVAASRMRRPTQLNLRPVRLSLRPVRLSLRLVRLSPRRIRLSLPLVQTNRPYAATQTCVQSFHRCLPHRRGQKERHHPIQAVRICSMPRIQTRTMAIFPIVSLIRYQTFPRRPRLEPLTAQLTATTTSNSVFNSCATRKSSCAETSVSDRPFGF